MMHLQKNFSDKSKPPIGKQTELRSSQCANKKQLKKPNPRLDKGNKYSKDSRSLRTKSTKSSTPLSTTDKKCMKGLALCSTIFNPFGITRNEK